MSEITITSNPKHTPKRFDPKTFDDLREPEFASDHRLDAVIYSVNRSLYFQRVYDAYPGILSNL
jgi:hypothetical protein